MIKRKRFCVYCHKVGITVTFDNGNSLRKHVKVRHPRTVAQRTEDKRKLAQYRKEQLLLLSRLGVRDQGRD